MNLRGTFLGLVIVSIAAWASPCWPEESKTTLKIVVPYPTGGGSDVVARLIAEQLKESLQKPVIVENKPGQEAAWGPSMPRGSPLMEAQCWW